MKNLLALIVVAILATSAMFATDQLATGTGTLEVTVEYPNIVITSPATVALTMKPGQTVTGQSFVFTATGAQGISLTTATGVWTTTNTQFVITPAGSNTAIPTAFDVDGNFAFTYGFAVLCKTGTVRKPVGEKYTMVYTLTLDY